jgi:hypothetical protein
MKILFILLALAIWIFSWINMIPESIIVGIANTDRKKISPTQVRISKIKDLPTSGKSAAFISFIEKNFNLIWIVILTPPLKLLYNHWGLLATEILLKKPNLFDHYIIVQVYGGIMNHY